MLFFMGDVRIDSTFCKSIVRLKKLKFKNVVAVCFVRLSTLQL